MTAKVLQFQSKEDRKPRTKKQPPSVFAKLNIEIFAEVLDDILGTWQAAAVKDGLDKYVEKQIPTASRSIGGASYTKDLNALSHVEQKLKMRVAVFYPGCTTSNQVGWLAAFHRDKDVFMTPPDMASEGYARAMNIVLFVAFEKTLKSLGRK
jgi:hypothetical protein